MKNKWIYCPVFGGKTHNDTRRYRIEKFPFILSEMQAGKFGRCERLGAVLTALNTAIANPSLIESSGEISVYSPTADVISKQNEISQMTDSPQIDFDRVKAEIFKLAE